VIGCLSGNVPLMWPKVAPLLERAVRYGGPGDSLAEWLADLLDARKQLWCVFVGRELKAAALTELKHDAAGHGRCIMHAVGGDGLSVWGPALVDTVKAWARAIGCQHFDALSPRRGWRRRAPALGFREHVIHWRQEL
jgi:hypothetical protein